jgi:ribosomal-protein-alanine N-acetyltransferase
MTWASVLARLGSQWCPLGARAFARGEVRGWRDVALLTPRCLLRAAQPADAESLFDASADPEFNRWLSWDPPELEAIAARFEAQHHNWQRARARCFTAVERETGLAFGGADLKADPFDQSPGTLNLGYWTHPNRQGQGFAREFVPAVVDWAFSEAGVTRLLAGVAPENTASHRILVRLGFTPFETRCVGREPRRMESVRYQRAAPNRPSPDLPAPEPG